MDSKQDWTDKEYKELFTFNMGLKSNSPDVVYYGELIELLNPNIQRTSIDEIPEHVEEKPTPSEAQLDALQSMLNVDPTLMANRYQIKKINPPEN